MTTAESIQAGLGERPRSGAASGDGYLLEAAASCLLFGAWLGKLGTMAPLLVLGSFGVILVLRPSPVLEGLKRCWPLLLVAAVVCLSTVWSTASAVTLRYSVELAITVAAGVAIASTINAAGFTRAVFWSCAAVLVASLLWPEQGASADGMVLIGVLGSKNEMGAMTAILLCSGMAVMAARDHPRWLRVLSLPCCAVASVVLLGSQSAGAVLAFVIFAGAFLALTVASRLPTASKILLLVCILAFAWPLWMIRLDLMGLWEAFLVDVLGKDPGLTGRDYLWAHADRLISDRPVLGHGFRSTWLGGGSDTIGLLRWAGLTSGAGFHFHDTYREWLVDFGYSGALVIGSALLAGMIKSIGRALARRTTANLIFIAAMCVVFAIRAKLENVFGPFGASTIVLIAVSAYGFLPLRDQVASPLHPVGRRGTPHPWRPSLRAVVERAAGSESPSALRPSAPRGSAMPFV